MTHDIVKTKVEGVHLNYIALLKKPQKRMSPEKLKQYRQSPSSYVVFHEKPFLKIKRVEAWRDRIWSTEFPSQDNPSENVMNDVIYDDDEEFDSDASEEEDSEDYCSSNSCSSQEDSKDDASFNGPRLSEKERERLYSLGPSEVEIEVELTWKSIVEEEMVRAPLIIDFNQILGLNDPSSLANKSSLQVAELENETILIFSPPFKNKWPEIRIGFNERQGFQDFWERLDFGEHYTLSKKSLHAMAEPPSKVFENQEKSGQGSRMNAVSVSSQS